MKRAPSALLTYILIAMQTPTSRCRCYNSFQYEEQRDFSYFNYTIVDNPQ